MILGFCWMLLNRSIMICVQQDIILFIYLSYNEIYYYNFFYYIISTERNIAQKTATYRCIILSFTHLHVVPVKKRRYFKCFCSAESKITFIVKAFFKIFAFTEESKNIRWVNVTDFLFLTSQWHLTGKKAFLHHPKRNSNICMIVWWIEQWHEFMCTFKHNALHT